MELLVTYYLKENNAESFLNELAKVGIPQKVREEKGCIRYEYFVSAERNDTVMLTEKWESKIMQALHMSQPHMKCLLEIKNKYVARTTVQNVIDQQPFCVS